MSARADPTPSSWTVSCPRLLTGSRARLSEAGGGSQAVSRSPRPPPPISVLPAEPGRRPCPARDAGPPHCVSTFYSFTRQNRMFAFQSQRDGSCPCPCADAGSPRAAAGSPGGVIWQGRSRTGRARPSTGPAAGTLLCSLWFLSNRPPPCQDWAVPAPLAGARGRAVQPAAPGPRPAPAGGACPRGGPVLATHFL